MRSAGRFNLKGSLSVRLFVGYLRAFLSSRPPFWELISRPEPPKWLSLRLWARL